IGLYFLSTYDIFPTTVLELILYYNTAILLFNLLPIWPLDGGKLFFVMLSSFLPYRKAYHFIIIFSMMFSLVFLLLQLFVFPFTLSAFFLMIFLFMENRTEWKQRFYVFIRFLLRRYEGHSNVKKVQPITVSHQNYLMDVFFQFKRGKKHPIYISYPDRERMFIDESDCLRSYFHDQQYNKTIGEVADKVSL
ncbi:MAG TPA: site-2 protease family protein, partial [Candidatus Dormibacteraeota bacterium]|nr:site-2 protease family protein [Candidatus Dormibacteraeota bacterium]